MDEECPAKEDKGKDGKEALGEDKMIDGEGNNDVNNPLIFIHKICLKPMKIDIGLG